MRLNLITNSKYNHKVNLNNQPQKLFDESFEIYSKISKGKVKFQKGRNYGRRFKSKICPITIIQAPITVNGK